MPPSSVHVLGIGNLGKLLAHSLRKNHPDVPVTLLFHRPDLAEEWKRAGESVEIVRNGVADSQAGFKTEDLMQAENCIENLVVATKTHSTVQAIRPLRNRLSSSSTLLFLQNGMGTIDQVTASLFSEEASRPIYLAGILNHGVYATGKFTSVHAGLANAIIGPVTERPASRWNDSPPFLAQKITDCPELSASLVSARELFHTQLQKLAVNAVINPLTFILNCLNGVLFHSTAIRGLMDRMIAEISAVILAIVASKNEHIDSAISARFSAQNLRSVVDFVGEQTARNISSMRQDMLAGRETEIDYINGYIVMQGVNFGIRCPINAKVVQLVKERKCIAEDQIQGLFEV